MSEHPFSLPPIPLMTPEKARDIARRYMALAESLRELEEAEAAKAERRSQWWLTYSMALAQSKPPDAPEIS